MIFDLQNHKGSIKCKFITKLRFSVVIKIDICLQVSEVGHSYIEDNESYYVEVMTAITKTQVFITFN